MPYGDLAKFIVGVVRAGKGQSRRVGKDRGSLFERHTMLVRLGRSLSCIPFKDHRCQFTAAVLSGCWGILAKESGDLFHFGAG